MKTVKPKAQEKVTRAQIEEQQERLRQEARAGLEFFTYFHNAYIICIRKTCPCNIYPLKPHFYIEKLGYAGVYLFFLFLLQNIDCGYSLELLRRGGSKLYPQSMF